MSTTISKRPNEQWPVRVEFYGRLPSGVTLSSATVSAYNVSDSSVDNTVLQSLSALISGDNAIVGVKAGTTGKQYRITTLATLSDGSILEDVFYMDVSDTL